MAGANLEIVMRMRDQASASLKNVGASTSDMSRQFTIAAVAAVAMGAAIAGALAMAVKAYAQEEKGIIRLRVAMKNVGLSYDANREAIEANINALQFKTAVADSAQRDSLASLVRITRDTAEAFDLLELAMDVAVGTGRDLESGTRALMYALGGNWGQVEELIPALKEAQDEETKWMMLRQLFAGQAEAYGKSLAGQFELLQSNIGDLKEAVGAVLAPTFSDFVGLIIDATEWIKKLNPRIVDLGVKALAAEASILILVGGLFLLVKYIPLIVIGLKTMAVTIITRYIPALIALIARTWAAVAAQVALLAASGPAGWIMLAAGVALAAGAVAGLYYGLKAIVGSAEDMGDVLAADIALLESAGYSVNKLASEEDELTDSIDDTTEALEGQERALQDSIDRLSEAGYAVEKLIVEEKDAIAAISQQEIESLRAAVAKGKLAEAAERLGLTEQEAQDAINNANLSMSEQEIAAYATSQKKRELADIAEELGLAEWELADILERANKKLEEQSGITVAPATSGIHIGTTRGIPGFQAGGIVTRPTIGMLAERGIPELVLPLTGGARLGSTQVINNYNTIIIETTALMGNEPEAREFARLILQYIRQDQKRVGAVVS